MVLLALQPAHGYIPLLVVGTTFVNFWAGMKVSKAREKYNILYPQMYAEQSDKNAKAFNCVQRAHQNVLEQIPVFFGLLLTSRYIGTPNTLVPRVKPLTSSAAAIAGIVRIAGLIVYVNGYVTGDPKKRGQGAFGYLGMLASACLSVEVGLRLLELI